MDRVLIISGPTGVGKTGFALEVAKKLDGELVSADSRQVYKGMDIITGKDLPKNAQFIISNLQWKSRRLGYYFIQGIKVWGYDIVEVDEEFNVSFWRECADLIIKDILSREKLPVVVGGTGLYIRSLTEEMPDMDIPNNPSLRNELRNKTVNEMFDILNQLNPDLARSLNESDRKNPRRLIRKIEINRAAKTPRSKVDSDFFQIGLFAPPNEIDRKIELRVRQRIARGAKDEYERIRRKYDSDLPSLTASGYKDWGTWVTREKQYARRQLTWFKKYGQIRWFDITKTDWKLQAESAIVKWHASQD